MALLLIGPAWPLLADHALGGEGTDALKHIWTQWWTWDRLVAEGGLPMRSHHLYFPEGGAFYGVDGGNVFLGAPLRPWLSPTLVYNLLIPLNLVLAALGAWALARELELRSPLLAGAIFAFNSWLLAFSINSGVTETLSLVPFPLILLAGLRVVSRPDRAAVVALPLLLAVQAFACWSYAIQASVLLAILGLVRIRSRAAALRVGLSVVLLALIALPAYLGVQGTVEEGAIYERHLSVFPSEWRPWTLAVSSALPLVDFIDPGGLYVADTGVDRLLYACWLGVPTMLLAALGLRRRPWIAALCALLLLLALGPRICLDHERIWPGLINVIYWPLYMAFPLFNATSHSPDRFVVGLFLGLGLLASEGWRWPRAWLGAGLVLLDLILVGPGPWPIETALARPHPAAQALYGGEGAVIDLPYRDGDQFISDIFFQQTVHQRPVPYRLDGVGNQVVSTRLLGNRFFRGLVGEGTPGRCEEARELEEMGFSAILWWTERAGRPPPEELERCFGAPAVYDGVAVFQ